VIASYHLGPLDALETRAYVEHRLATVGWNGDPSFDDGAHAAIHAYSGGIPRKINTLMDRVLLMGYLEELHAFDAAAIDTVIRDIDEEYQMPEALAADPAPAAPALAPRHAELAPEPAPYLAERRASSVEVLDERMMRLEKSIVSVLSILKKIVANPNETGNHHVDNQK
jgi:hypothetical protein